MEIQEQENSKENLEEVARQLRRRSKIDYDSALAICGEEGAGKSNLAIKLAKLIDPNFNLADSEVYSTSTTEVFEKMTNKKIKVLIFDEAIKSLYKLNWNTSSAKYLNTLFALARQENKVVIMCLPRFRDINEYFRNHRLRFWIQILIRGKAILLVRDNKNMFCKDPWWMDFNSKLLEEAMWGKKIMDIRFADHLRMIGKTKNFIMEINYDDFSPEEKEEYLTIVGSNKYKDVNKIMDEPDKDVGRREARLMNIIVQQVQALVNKGYSLNKASKLYGVSSTTLQEWIEVSKTSERCLKLLSNAKNIQADNIYQYPPSQGVKLNFLNKLRKMPYV